MIGIDTNLLVRYITQDDAKQAERASVLLESLDARTKPGFINRITLIELIWVLESAYGYCRMEIGSTVETILNTASLIVENADATRTALEIYRATNNDFADILVALCNREASCQTTMTFDRRAARLEQMTLV